MHTNLSITDGIYGMLSKNDVREQITSLDQKMFAGEYSAKQINELLIQTKSCWKN